MKSEQQRGPFQASLPAEEREGTSRPVLRESSPKERRESHWDNTLKNFANDSVDSVSAPLESSQIAPEILAPERSYGCKNYDTCLELAAALDWDSFTCAGCCGEFDRQLLWRAQHALKKNPALAKLYSLLQKLQSGGG